MELGQTIKIIRKENNLTQNDFAESFHVTRQTVSNWENEKSYPDLMTLVEISNKFDISLDTMLKGDSKVAKQMNRDLKWGKWSKLVLGIAAAVLATVSIGWFGVWEYNKVRSEGKYKEGLSQYESELVESDGNKSMYKIKYDENSYFILPDQTMPSYFEFATDFRAKDIDCCVETGDESLVFCWAAYDGNADNIQVNSKMITNEQKEQYADLIKYGCDLYEALYR